MRARQRGEERRRGRAGARSGTVWFVQHFLPPDFEVHLSRSRSGAIISLSLRSAVRFYLFCRSFSLSPFLRAAEQRTNTCMAWHLEPYSSSNAPHFFFGLLLRRLIIRPSASLAAPAIWGLKDESECGPSQSTLNYSTKKQGISTLTESISPEYSFPRFVTLF